MNTTLAQEYFLLSLMKRPQNKRNSQLIQSPFSQTPSCVCKPLEEKKFSSITNTENISNYTRISKVIQRFQGGKLQIRLNPAIRDNQIIPVSPLRNKFV